MSMRRNLLRIVAWGLAAMLAPGALYLLAALALGVAAVNTDFRPAADGVRIWVRTNGLHAEFIVPTRAAGVDWSESFPATDMRGLAAPLEFIAFGWGDAAFFAQTPTWRDLEPRVALAALSGSGEGALHVEYLAAPSAYAGRALQVSRAQYLRLADYISASAARGSSGRPRKLPAAGYFETDAFYAAIPRYSPTFTSNDWVRRGLTVAGVRAPRWSPFDVALFYQLSRVPR